MGFLEFSGVHLTDSAPPTVEVTIEIPRGSFLKRGSDGHIDFISPLPCPYNYGSVEDYIGGEGDYLDAVVLGPRLPLGSRVQVQAHGAIGMSERFMYDDKLICSSAPLTAVDRRRLLYFFRLYASCKGVLNVIRGQRGPSNCEGWGEASAAIARAVPSSQGEQRPQISF
jgi:inorganic pyrophosphatase